MSYYELYHSGRKEMKWGQRLYQYKDGSLTPLGKMHYRQMRKERQKSAEEASKTGGKVGGGSGNESPKGKSTGESEAMSSGKAAGGTSGSSQKSEEDKNVSETVKKIEEKTEAQTEAAVKANGLKAKEMIKSSLSDEDRALLKAQSEQLTKLNDELTSLKESIPKEPARQKSVKEMSDSELKDAVARLSLEKKYSELNAEPSKSKYRIDGKEIAKNIATSAITTVGTKMATNLLTMAVVKAGGKNLVDLDTKLYIKEIEAKASTKVSEKQKTTPSKAEKSPKAQEAKQPNSGSEKKKESK